VTQKVLTEHLKQLERAGIVRRFFYTTIPPRIEYELMKTGLELLKLTGDITTWFDSHSEVLHKSQKTYDKKRVTVLRRL
jgi:transcriptional regulator